LRCTILFWLRSHQDDLLSSPVKVSGFFDESEKCRPKQFITARERRVMRREG
jgi:hypothetical protein